MWRDAGAVPLEGEEVGVGVTGPVSVEGDGVGVTTTLAPPPTEGEGEEEGVPAGRPEGDVVSDAEAGGVGGEDGVGDSDTADGDAVTDCPGDTVTVGVADNEFLLGVAEGDGV